jgi:hypothetical protein
MEATVLSYSKRGEIYPTAPTTLERGKSKPSSSPLLPGIWGVIYINIYIITNIISISISKIHLTPLIVCGRLNPRYCASAICIIVIGNLSLS